MSIYVCVIHKIMKCGAIKMYYKNNLLYYKKCMHYNF